MSRSHTAWEVSLPQFFTKPMAADMGQADSPFMVSLSKKTNDEPRANFLLSIPRTCNSDPRTCHSERSRGIYSSCIQT